ncbi:glycosyltransferase [Caenispirillum salinarum]|uniref:glycosyltransferase n=1 Tax=Caenispirillum salinarum TaxID=859058 RepID=UPI00384D196E
MTVQTPLDTTCRPPPRHVLLTSDSGQFGGMEMRMIDEARALRDMGHRVTVAVADFSGRDRMADRLRDLDVPLEHHEPARVLSDYHHRFRARWQAATRPETGLARFAPDLVHVFFSWTDQGIDHLWAAGRAGLPAVASIRNSFTPWPLTRWHRLHLPTAFRSVRALYGVSGAALDSFAATFDPWIPDDARRTVIHNGVDTDRFVPSPTQRLRARKSLGIPGHVPVVGSVGRLADQKRPLELLDIFRRVRRRLPEARLVLVGSGHLETQVREEITRTGLGEAVVIIPFTQAVEALYCAMDLHLVISRNEGFSSVIAEAMACGVPVVGTRVPGTEEVIRGTKAGALVPFGDPAAIARTVIDILESGADARARLGQAGREAAVMRYSRDAWLARITRFYAEVLNPAAPSAAAVAPRGKGA